MAKAKTIQEKRAEMERELERLTAFETIINKLECDMKWDFCSIRVDEDGNNVRDEANVDWVFDPPKPDDWGYERYIAYKSALDEIKALV